MSGETEYYRPSTLHSYAKAVEKLRHDMLCIDETGADQRSEQFHLLALSALELAQHYIVLAALEQAAANSRRTSYELS